ncbi:MAG: hypothetical protein M2R45_03166 [Verrucomicrobia subdivision 3 bacterium]|nr:hypothetical protein [Limisphaerales bacterium]MCS1413233.1 hypothetical protein [Limisphaerales bacterium]
MTGQPNLYEPLKEGAPHCCSDLWNWRRRVLNEINHNTAQSIGITAICSPRYQTLLVDDPLPSYLKPRAAYLVIAERLLKHAAFTCSYGHGRNVQLNLFPDERPRWKTVCPQDSTVSLHPASKRRIVVPISGCNMDGSNGAIKPSPSV